MPSPLRGIVTLALISALLVPAAPALAAGEPTNTAAPTITGVPIIGTTLTATDGTWTGSPTLYEYQWLRCAAGGGSCAPIGGAVSSSYVISEADSRKSLRIRVTASNGSGETDADSAPTSVVFGQQAYAKASNTNAGDLLGFTIAVSGDTMVVGAPYEQSATTDINGTQSDNSASFSGAAYVYVRNTNGAWTQQAYLKSSNNQASDLFGVSVAISGDTIVVGAPYEDSSAGGGPTDNSASAAGAVYVFVRSGSTWTEQAILKADNAETDDLFGQAVAIDGDYIIVGAPQEDSNATGIGGSGANNAFSNSGAAYVFSRGGAEWSQQAYLKASNTGAGDLFGFAVSISGSTAVVGTYAEDSSATGIDGDGSNNDRFDAGAAYVFTRDGVNWTADAYLKASNTDIGDHFGYSVSIDGDYLVIGAPTEDSNSTGVGGDQANNSATSAGAAYIFRNSSGVWTQWAYLKASNTGAGDLFGFSVGISGRTLAIGSVNADSGVSGINGNQSDTSASDAGAVYLFTLLGTWTQIGYYKASTAGAGDQFGYSLGFSGETLVVGAPNEDSAAIGVNGDQASNAAAGSGAAYAFVVTGAAPLNAGAPQALGAPVPGSTLVADVGQWYFTPTSFTYQWQRCSDPFTCVDITGATASTYSVLESDVGSFLRFYMFAINPYAATPAVASVTMTAGQYQRVGLDYTYLKASNTEEFDYLGSAVAIDGDTVVVGAPFEDSSATGINGNQSGNAAEDSGAAYVYVRTSGVWTQQAYLKADNTAADAWFGYSVAIDGDTIVVGAPNEGGSGAAYVFKRSDTTWTQQGYLKADNAGATDSFGYTVAISVDTIVIGAPNEDAAGEAKPDSGAAYVFTRSSGSWTQQAYLKASNADSADTFGVSVDIDADLIVVGASRESSSANSINGDASDNSAAASGAAYLFTRTAALWTQAAYLKSSGPSAYDYFGAAVAVSGSTVMVGAPFDDDFYDDQGLVHVFGKTDGAWEYKREITAPNRKPNQHFGTTIALDGDFLVVGYPTDDSAATGVAGDMHNSGSEESGAVHVFYLRTAPFDPSNRYWDHFAYLKASNNDAGDVFGYAVAVSGDQVVIGARGESSSATGINGELNNNSAPNSGAAYVRSLSGIAPQLVTAPAITGTTSVGQTLTASTGTWAFSPTSYTYQWQLCNAGGDNCANIDAATTSTYALIQSDAGATVRVIVTATNETGSAQGVSLTTAWITSAPVSTALPAISGTTLVGQTLTTTDGTWSYSPTSYTYQWQRCDSAGANCVNIPGSTASTRALTPQDAGRKLKVVVTATNAVGNTSATSEATAVITSPAPPPPPPVVAAPPVNLTLPLISGSASVASVLSTTNGTWTNVPTSYAYQWQRCDAAGANCVNIPGATTATYRLVSGDLGLRFRVQVTASNADGSATSTSLTTDAVGPEITTPVTTAPANLTLPQISGDVRVGGVLTASTGTWSNSPSGFAYQWLRCEAGTCTAVTNATQATLTLVQADAGVRFQVKVSATNAGGTATIASEQTAAVASKPINATRPTISGKAKVGAKLTARVGVWNHEPTTLTYQWWRCSQTGKCVKIAKATGKKVTITKVMIGAQILVKVRASNAVGASIAPSAKSRAIRR